MAGLSPGRSPGGRFQMAAVLVGLAVFAVVMVAASGVLEGLQ